jgi:hypothetical protein
VRFVFEVAGDRQIDRELLRVGDRAVDASPAFEAIGVRLLEIEREQFDSQGGRGSGGWKPLKPATIREKARRGEDPRILHRTRRLVMSLTERGSSDQIFEVSADGLVFGSRLPYAGAHQNPRPGNPLPQRRPVEFTETDRRDIVKTLQRWIMTGEVE